MSKIYTPAMEKIEKKRRKKGNTKVRESTPAMEAWKRLKRNKTALLGITIIFLLIVCALFPEQIAPYGEDEQNYSVAFTAPCSQYPLGTDNYGRDLLSRIIFGCKTSLLIGICSVGVSLLMGSICGLLAAYFGGPIDNLVMRITDIFYSLPSVLLAIAIASALGSSLPNLVMAISISQIPVFARVVRAAGITVRNQEYMEAARSIGCSSVRMMIRHMLPNAAAPLIVQATLGVATAILIGASLSFVGVGIAPPTAEWGYMLNAGRQYIRSAWYIITFPGVAIMITIFAMNLFGDGLRDALDPKMKR